MRERPKLKNLESRRFLIVLIVSAIAAIWQSGTVADAQSSYYVAPNGVDSNPGTLTAPLRTIQQAVNLAKAGDTVVVADGTYGPEGHYTCGNICSQKGYAAPVVFYNSGTASAPITITAQNKWGAILDCNLPYGYSGDGTDGVQACDTYFDFQSNASYITIRDFQITRGYWSGANVNGSNNHNIRFVGNHFHDVGNRHYVVPSGTESYGIVGVYAGTATSNIAFDGNLFNNIGRLPTSGQSSTDYNHDHGLYLYNGPYVVTNNVFYSNTAGWGIQISPGTHDTAIQNNTFANPNPQQDGQIMLWGNNSNITIQNNIFYKPRNYAIATWQASESNTLIDTNMICCSGVGVIDTAGSGVTVANETMNVDPVFASLSASDFHLQSTSPAIDGAVAIPSITTDLEGVLRPQGLGYDLGAYEFPAASGTSTTPPPPPPPTTATTFDTSLSGTAVTVSKRQSASVKLSVILLSGASQAATFAVSGLPPGLKASWSASSCVITCASSLRLSASPRATTGSWVISLRTTVAGASDVSNVTVTVY
jgi:parallel beta helix pectate lyase-like protein/uncharacterized protein DUF1565